MGNRLMLFRYPGAWRLTWAILVLFGAATAHARMIDVRIELDSCGRIYKNVSIVMNNVVTNPPPLEHNQTYLIWTGHWNDVRDGGQFPDVPLSASLHVDGARTDCKFAEVEKGPHGVFVAVFKFGCDENPTGNLMIQAEPFLYSYVRSLKRSRTKKVDCDCVEKSDSYGGTHTIRDVRLPAEKIHFELEYSATDIFWIVLNDLPVVRNHKKGTSDTLGWARVAEAIVRSTPSEEFSPNAYKIVNLNAKIKRDTKLTVAVK